MENEAFYERVLDKEPALNKIEDIRKSLAELTELIPYSKRVNEFLGVVNGMRSRLSDLTGEIMYTEVEK